MADGKPFSAWLSGDLLKSATDRAGDLAGGNESKYVKSLIERDVAAAQPGQLLVELAKQYHPAVASKLDGLGDNGPAVLAQLLDALSRAMMTEKFALDRPFEIVSHKRFVDFQQKTESGLRDLAHIVSEMSGKKGDKYKISRKKKARSHVVRKSTGPALTPHDQDKPA